MEHVDPVKQILAESLDYRLLFQARLDYYCSEQRQLTAKALLGCSSTLSRKFGHVPEDYMFGNDVFAETEIGELLANLRRLQEHADANNFHEGVTAVCALEAIAGLVSARFSASDEATHIHIKLRKRVVIDLIRQLIDEYRGGATLQHRPSAAG